MQYLNSPLKAAALLLLLLIHVFPDRLSARDRTSLDGQWTLDYWKQPKHPVTTPEQFQNTPHETIQAMVPGNVELDLFSAGLIPDPEKDANTELIRCYEGYQWRYSRHFRTPGYTPEDNLILDFEGVDCFAEVYVNGRHAGSTANMLIAHRMDISSLVRPQGEDNLLEVILRSSVEEGRKYIPPTLSLNWTRPETVYMRRAPHTYGWDIMPRLVSAGLWRSVFLEVEHPLRLRDVHWMTTNADAEKKIATVLVDYTLTLPVEIQDDVFVRVTMRRNGKTAYERTHPVAMHAEREKINLGEADLWWPRGYGEAALYEGTVEIVDSKGTVMDQDTRRVGVRTILLESTPTHTPDHPGQFRFIVNGVPVFIHGSNWTPLDALHSRDPKHLEKAVALAEDLNCNMLRCWGGGVYEDTPFYDLCDEKGIMIWQDFCMGCSFYPLDDDFQKVIAEEVRHVVLKLRSHACLALWAGNNEDDEMITDGNFSLYRPDPNRDRVTRQTIPNVLFELDPIRPYLPSSPYWSEQAVKAYNSSVLPERHLWGPRGYYKAPFYTSEAHNLFASETGYHGMPERSSLERMFSRDNVYPWTNKKDFHWKDAWISKSVREYAAYGYSHDRNDLMINQVRILFKDVPTDLDAFIRASQVVQAEAMKFFVERFRGHKFAPMTGILWWNIKDGWPIISDAVTDYYFNKKLAYHFLKNVQKNVLVMLLDKEGEGLPLVVSNDTRSPQKGTVTVYDVESGRTLYEGRYDVAVNGRSVITSIAQPLGQGVLAIRYEGEDGEVCMNHYLYGEPPFKLDHYTSLLKKVGIYNLP